MHGQRFDDIARTFGAKGTSRRMLLRAFAAGAIGTFLPASARVVVAQAACDAPFIDCDGLCVNPSYDSLNCGACGNACAEGESCQDGACSGVIACDGCGDADVCVDFATDDAHCGGCDNACADQEVCRGGRCVVPPPEATPSASPTANQPTACRVAPRAGAARAIPDGTPRASLVASFAATPAAAETVLPVLAEEELPAGEPAAADVVAGITATVEQVAACAAPSSPGIVAATGEPDLAATPLGPPAVALPVADLGVEPVLALYSDDYFRRPGVVTTNGIVYWAPRTPGPLEIRGARMQADGRMGAIVSGAGNPPVFLLFVEADGVYLIDEVLALTSVGTPVP